MASELDLEHLEHLELILLVSLVEVWYSSQAAQSVSPAEVPFAEPETASVAEE